MHVEAYNLLPRGATADEQRPDLCTTHLPSQPSPHYESRITALIQHVSMRKETVKSSYKSLTGLGVPLNLQCPHSATATVISIRRGPHPRRTFAKLFGKVRLGFQGRLGCRRCTNLRIGKRRKVHGGSRTSSTSLYSFGSDLIDQENPSSKQISERIRKLEQLFEKFVCRKSSVTGAFATARGRNKNERKFDLPVLASDKQSISSIGDRIVS
jgi:hypothetical protein